MIGLTSSTALIEQVYVVMLVGGVLKLKSLVETKLVRVPYGGKIYYGINFDKFIVNNACIKLNVMNINIFMKPIQKQ